MAYWSKKLFYLICTSEIKKGFYKETTWPCVVRLMSTKEKSAHNMWLQSQSHSSDVLCQQEGEEKERLTRQIIMIITFNLLIAKLFSK